MGGIYTRTPQVLAVMDRIRTEIARDSHMVRWPTGMPSSSWNHELLNRYKSEIGCRDCGERDWVVLDLHHRDDEEKLFSVSSKAHGSNFYLLCDEVAKCDVLCSNCHRREHHAKRRAAWVQKFRTATGGFL